MRRYLIIAILFALFASSCNFEREVDIDYSSVKPHLVLNSLLYPGKDSCFFYITESRSSFVELDSTWWGTQKYKFDPIEDATLDLFVNETLHKIRYSPKDSAYVFPGKLKSEDNIRVKVVQKDRVLTSSTALPIQPNILSVDTAKVTKLMNEYQNDFLEFKVKIKDYPGQKDYYRLEINRYDRKYEYGYGYGNYYMYYYYVDYYTNDPVLLNGIPADNGYPELGIQSTPGNYLSLFRDVFFEGKEYTLTFYIAYPSDLLDPESEVSGNLDIRVQSISGDLYKYYYSLQRNRYINYYELKEPIVIYKNIEGGLGILGSYNETTVFQLTKESSTQI